MMAGLLIWVTLMMIWVVVTVDRVERRVAAIEKKTVEAGMQRVRGRPGKPVCSVFADVQGFHGMADERIAVFESSDNPELPPEPFVAGVTQCAWYWFRRGQRWRCSPESLPVDSDGRHRPGASL